MTQLNDADIAEVATAFGLGAVTTWEVVEAGTINSNFSLRADGERFFLRINEGKEEADVRFEAELLERLAAGGIRTPVPKIGAEYEPFICYKDRFLSLFPWVEGTSPSRDEVVPDHAQKVGEQLAKLHLLGQKIAHSLTRDGIYTFTRIKSRLVKLVGIRDPLIQAVIPSLLEEASWLDARGRIRDKATRGIIHGDLFRDNTLFAPDGSVTFIDFEQASLGSFAYDIAVSLLAWCYKETFDPECMAAFMLGYQRVRELPEADRAALYLEARAAAMRFTVTRITDVHLAGNTDAEKDFRRYHRRLEDLREMGADGFQAALGVEDTK